MTGLSARQLDHWSQQGLFVPGVRLSQGPGTRRLYSLEDVVQLRSLKKLKCYRWSTQKLRGAIEMLREVMRDTNPLRQAVLIGDRKTLLAVYKTRQGEQVLLDALRPGGQTVLSLVIETVEAETRQLVLSLADEGNADG